MGAALLILLATMRNVATADAAPPADVSAQAVEAKAPSEQPLYWRTALETGLVLVLGTAWYWRHPSTNADDWDLRFDAESWKRKTVTFDALRFDDNLFQTNGFSHPRSGLAYYQIARGNRLSFGASFLTSFVASLVWEYVPEFKELPSINDIVLTPFGGTVLGESTFRLGRFFADGGGGPVSSIGAILLSPIASLNDALEGRPVSRPGPTRRASRELFAGIGRAQSSALGDVTRTLELEAASWLVIARAYGVGQGAVAVGPGAWTRLALRASFDGGSVEGVAVHGYTLIAGRYDRAFDEPEADVPTHTQSNGAGFLIGVGSAFDYDTRDLHPLWDRVASAGLLGPIAELSATWRSLRLRFTVNAEYAFAMITSLAYSRYGYRVGQDTVMEVLQTQSYYYAQGVTGTADLTVWLGDVDVNLNARGGAFWSWNGRDRRQESLQRDLALTDQRAWLTASAGVKPLGGPVRLVLRTESVIRRSHMLGETASADETRIGFAAQAVF